ncbi:MAG TPA: PD-(D/E)XK nuclease family protein, partial [Salinimicrobium sp.]|nr:PD-(D/E)XK nuclease family protein [Salinimicrobium sp.]
KILFGLYKDLIGTTTLDIKGQPFKGLQIMGMLESRVLDFERVIIASVNEGVLPAGKSANSFIPFELKKAYNLPSYKEKDAVYTYHFYHLLQRSADIKLLYNTETDGLNAGEKSRFLIQLEVEKQKNHQLETITVSPQVPKIVSTLKQVEKTPDILEKLKSLAESGFSPSALTTYIRNPLDFYTQYILGIRDTDAVEETVAANTLGTAVHNTLEYFYKALAEEKALVTELFLKESIKNTPEIVAAQFKEIYTKAPLDKGKNLLIFEVAKRYVINFLKAELNEISLGNETKILQIEADLKKEIFIEGLDFPIFIRGKVDRIDAYNGKTRIIDYKTGKVLQNELEITDWELLTTDYDKYSKPFQVLTYASMVSGTVAEPMEAGVFSFKNMQAGFLKFSKKDENSKSKNFDINEETIEAYSSELKKLILEICNPSIPFIEKEIKQKNW